MPESRPDRAASGYLVLVVLTAVVVLLQGLWAGLFVHEGKNYSQGWVEVHARGADVAIVLAALAAVLALVRLRGRRDLWAGAAVLCLALVVEAYLGGLIGDSPAVTAIHFPLAMLIMGLAVWLPVRARTSTRSAAAL